jgi:DNA-binding NtrC family response regulator
MAGRDTFQPASETQDRPLHPLVGGSEAMREVLDYAAKAARSAATVLITGETGTGKENIARYIHRHSERRDRRLVCIDCAAFPSELIEGELFGYERGAFTGAGRAFAGKLALADGGTVLLDEIGELPLTAQAKLLRFLESREVFGLGASAARRIDVRVLAATNQDLDRLAGTPAFRRDLYFRLNVARIHLPPLRSRVEDIPALVDHYVREMSQRTGVRFDGLADEAIDRLMHYPWPGNVRELRNVVEALFVDPPDGRAQLQDLPPNIARLLALHELDSPCERARIVSALFATHWNKCRAAERLQWSRMTLYRKMAKYAIGEGDRSGPDATPRSLP